MKHKVIIFVLLTIVSPNLFAQGVKVITGATLIDGTGRAPVEDSIIVIEGARIRQAGAKSRVEVPKDAAVIDARGKFVTPGLADMHNHLRDGFSSGRQALTNARRLMAFGVTTIFFPNANLQLLNTYSRGGIARWQGFA